MCTPWNTIFLECSDRKLSISVTVASNGNPLSRIQSLNVPDVIICWGKTIPWNCRCKLIKNCINYRIIFIYL